MLVCFGLPSFIGGMHQRELCCHYARGWLGCCLVGLLSIEDEDGLTVASCPCILKTYGFDGRLGLLELNLCSREALPPFKRIFSHWKAVVAAQKQEGPKKRVPQKVSMGPRNLLPFA